MDEEKLALLFDKYATIISNFYREYEPTEDKIAYVRNALVHIVSEYTAMAMELLEQEQQSEQE